MTPIREREHALGVQVGAYELFDEAVDGGGLQVVRPRDGRLDRRLGLQGVKG
jgi:hypothetical protein